MKLRDFHVNWQKFTTPLRRKPGLELPEGYDELGMILRERKNRGR